MSETKKNGVQVPTITLNNGMEMPVLGLGTYLAEEGECEKSVKAAIDAGYRHIDTAYYYGNETEVGNAVRQKIADGVIKREDVFVVTKLWNSFHAPEHVEMACQKSIENLNLGPIDLYLMHSPMAYKYDGGFTPSDLTLKDSDGTISSVDIDYVDTWKAMEQLQAKGLVRALGVSNFNSQQLERLLNEGTIRPVTNQIEISPNFTQRKLLEFCRERNIVVTAYGPLGRPYRNTPDGIITALHDSRVTAIANKYKKTSAQIILKYLIQIGTVPIPKSSNTNRLIENINVFDFNLSEVDLLEMNGLDIKLRLTQFPLCTKHKYFPFHVEF